MAGYRDLKVWRDSMNFSLLVYRLTQGFPSDERFGLVTQLRRASVSIPSNLAEGHGRGSRKELARYAAIAKGSLCEVETQLLLCAELGFADHDSVEGLLKRSDEIGRMLAGLIRSSRS